MNALLSDTFVDFLLYEVLQVEALGQLPAFSGLGRDTVEAWLASCRKVAREVLFPSYRPIDAAPPHLVGGKVQVHPLMHRAWSELTALGVISASRQLPLSVTTFSSAYLMAGSLSAFGFAGLTAGAAHLIEVFGSEDFHFGGRSRSHLEHRAPGVGSHRWRTSWDEGCFALCRAQVPAERFRAGAQ